MLHALSFDGNQVELPAPLVDGFEPLRRGRRIIVTAGLDPVISVYPLVEWEIIVSEVERLPSVNPHVRRLQRILFGNALSMRLNADRVLEVSNALKSYAGIRKNATAVIFPGKIEIWNPATLRTILEGFSERQIAALVEVIHESSGMGNDCVLKALCPIERIISDPALRAR